MVLSAQERILRTITESSWQKTVTDLMTLHGWLWFHAPSNLPQRGGWVQNIKPGFPDLCAVRRDRLLFVELKTELGKASAAQIEWVAAVRVAGAESFIWRPSDLEMVKATLR